MRVLVTGATGFIGGHIVEALLKEGHEVRCLVRSFEKAADLSALGAEVAEGDVGSLDRRSEIFEGVDTVFHAAARVQAHGKWSGFVRDTVLGTQNVLAAAFHSGAERFIYLSSIGTYDRRLTSGSSQTINEEDWGGCNVEELDSYCRAKRLAEEEVWRHHFDGFVKATVIRPVTVYGPRDKPVFFHLAKALESGEFCWINNFDPVVGMLNVADLVDLSLRVISNPVAIGKAYNAGPKWPVQLREFILLTCNELDIDYPTKKLPYAVANLISCLDESISTYVLTKREPAMTRLLLLFLTKANQRCSIERAKNDLGWEPRVGLLEGLSEAVQSYRNS